MIILLHHWALTLGSNWCVLTRKISFLTLLYISYNLIHTQVFPSLYTSYTISYIHPLYSHTCCLYTMHISGYRPLNIIHRDYNWRQQQARTVRQNFNDRGLEFKNWKLMCIAMSSLIDESLPCRGSMAAAYQVPDFQMVTHQLQPLQFIRYQVYLMLNRRAQSWSVDTLKVIFSKLNICTTAKVDIWCTRTMEAAKYPLTS